MLLLNLLEYSEREFNFILLSPNRGPKTSPGSSPGLRPDPGLNSVPNRVNLYSCKGNLYVILWSMLGSNKSLTKHLLGNISVSHLLYLLTGKHFKLKYFVITYRQLVTISGHLTITLYSGFILPISSESWLYD